MTTTLRGWIAVVLSASLGAACLVPPNDTNVGKLDGGDGGGSANGGGAAGGGANGGGAAGGGAAGGGAAGGGAAGGGAAGGGAAGGGAAGGGSNPFLIPSAGAAPSVCNTSRGSLREALWKNVPTDAGCGYGCVWEATETAARKLYQGGPSPDLSYGGSSANTPDWHVFVAYVSAVNGARKLMAVQTIGGPSLEIETLPAGMNATASAVSYLGKLYYVLSVWPQVAGAPRQHWVKSWAPATGVMTHVQPTGLPSSPLQQAPIVANGQLVLRFADGLYRFDGTTAFPLHASSTITALAIASNGKGWFAETRSGTPTLWRIDLGGTTPVLVDTQLGLAARELATENGDEAIALAGEDLFRIFPGPVVAFTAYRGGPALQGVFPKLSGLAAVNGKVYVGEVCYPDADAPDWGTVELSPQGSFATGQIPTTPGTSKWLTGTPAWPWQVPVLLDRSSASGDNGERPRVRTPRGYVVWGNTP